MAEMENCVSICVFSNYLKKAVVHEIANAVRCLLFHVVDCVLYSTDSA